MTDKAHRWLNPTTASLLSFPALAWQRLCRVPNPTNCNSHRSRSCPFSPAVTACHMVYCSSPSWEGCDCSREPPRPAERVPQPARSGPGVRLGSALHGSVLMAGHCLLQLRVTSVFLRATSLALALSQGAPGRGRVSGVRLAGTCPALADRECQDAVWGCCVSARGC